MTWILAMALFFGLDFSSVDLVQKGKIRWSRRDGEARITVQIAAGLAARENPNWSPRPEKLAYDLERNRTLERAIRAAHLGGDARGHESALTRTLELDVQGRDGEWRHAGTWTLPLKTWRKGRFAAVYELLEPLLTVKPELFETIPQKEPEPQ